MMHKVTAKVWGGNDADYDSLDQWQRDANSWTVELHYRGRQMRVNYWTGVGITDDPTAADVLESLCSDASNADESFEVWCSEYGYDTDSRKAERIYDQVRRQTARLRAFLGDDFDTIRYMDETELRKVTR